MWVFESGSFACGNEGPLAPKIWRVFFEDHCSCNYFLRLRGKPLFLQYKRSAERRNLKTAWRNLKTARRNLKTACGREVSFENNANKMIYNKHGLWGGRTLKRLGGILKRHGETIKRCATKHVYKTPDARFSTRCSCQNSVPRAVKWRTHR